MLNFSLGFVSGFATGFLTREFVSFGGGIIRPIVKSTMMAGVVGYEKTRIAFAHMSEAFEDLLAEVRSETKQPAAPATAKEAARASEAAASVEEEPAKMKA